MRETTPRIQEMSAADLVSALCVRVGLNPTDVGELRITPRKLTARVYKRNANGQKYLGSDGEPAIEIWEVQLR